MRRQGLEQEYYFAYAAQLTSFAVLAISNIVLPNFLGSASLYRFNEAMATSLITFSLTGDGVLFIAADYEVRRGRHTRAAFFLRLTAEHVILAGLLCVPVYLALHPAKERSVPGFSTVLATTVVVTLYNSLIFYCAATFRNRAVALMALWNGILYFTVPVTFHAAHAPIFLAPVTCFGFSLLPAVSLVSTGLRKHLSSPRSAIREVLEVPHLINVGEVMTMSAGRAFKMLILWGPVLYIGGRGDSLGASNYRVMISMMEGVGALVPYPKNAMLPLLRNEEFRSSLTAARAVHLSMFAVAAGTLGLVAFSGLLVSYLFIPEYAGVVTLIIHGAPYLPLMIAAMVLANAVAAEGRIRPLAVCYIWAAALGAGTLWLSGGVIAAILVASTALVVMLLAISSAPTRSAFYNIGPLIGAFALAYISLILVSWLPARALIFLLFTGMFFVVDPLGKLLRKRYLALG